MGVPGLWPFIRSRFGRRAVRHFQHGANRYQFNYVYLDANGLLHGAAQQVYNYGEHKRKLDPYSKLTNEEKMAKVFEIFFDNILDVTSMVVPTTVLYIAIDGPAPRAKQNQQRERRFIAARTRLAEEAVVGETRFDSNSITPGTEFMHRLSQYMYWKVRHYMQTRGPWRNFQVIYSPPTIPGEGEHKCYSPDTKVLMWSGEIKAIVDIKVGDSVVGDDGKPRKVTSTVSGTSDMFLVSQTNGDSYTVTDDHIMCFEAADHCRKSYYESDQTWVVSYFDRDAMKFVRKRFDGAEVGNDVKEKRADEFLNTIDPSCKVDMKLDTYLKMPPSTQRRFYGYKCPDVDWPGQDILIDPYILGTWLGDGHSSGQGFASVDNEVVQAWVEYAESVGCEVNQSRGNKIVYNISSSSKHRNKGCNNFLSSLQDYDLVNNKHIPLEYLCNSKQVRLQLLAGLIDTDGNVTHAGRMIRFSQGPKNFPLFGNVVTLAQSLGFKCCVREGKTTYPYKGEKKRSIAKFLTISGKVETIPMKIPRKKCVPLETVQDITKRSINVDGLRTSITVKPVGAGEYVGINIDGNRRFLLGDLTVGHNCLDFIRDLPERERANATHCMFGPDGDLLMLTLAAHVKHMSLFREDQYNPGNYDLVNMSNVRRGLAQSLGQWTAVRTKQRTEDDVSNDFIFMGFFVGNDFLPKVKMFYKLDEGLQKMFDTYIETSDQGFQNHLTKDNQVLVRGFRKFVYRLSEFEEEYLAAQAVITARDPRFVDHTLLKYATVTTAHAGVQTVSSIDMKGYREGYYNKAGISGKNTDVDFEAGIRDICIDYFRNLVWVYLYYIDGLPSWEQAYGYHYAPLLTDFATYLDTLNQNDLEEVLKFDKSHAALPFEQLLSVLPPASSALLPEHYQSLMTSEDSSLVEAGYYPATFDIDYEGKRREHEGIALLPFVNYTAISKAYLQRKVETNLRWHRNQRGKVYAFLWKSTGFSAHFKSHYGEIKGCKVRVTPV